MDQKAIIQAIVCKNPEVTEEKILESLKAEKTKTAGLIADETLLRYIAANYGVEISLQQPKDCKLLISHLIPGLNNVTLTGRIVAVFPVRTFEGVKPGKFASLLIVDSQNLLRVMLWNGKADLIESGLLQVGQIVRFLKGYTRQDREGKVELHLGEKGSVEINPADLDEIDFSFIDKFVVSIKEIMGPCQCVHVMGKIKATFPISTFNRQDNSVGKVLRFKMADETGEVAVVVWNEKAEKLEASIKNGVEVKLINAKVKNTPNDAFEVHVDETSYVEVFRF
jgi:ssDNA-binding replication factor A large subunit